MEDQKRKGQLKLFPIPVLPFCTGVNYGKFKIGLNNRYTKDINTMKPE